jgi:hypothetical protein
VRSKVDHYIYSKEEGGCFIYVALYVDDMLVIGNNMDAIKEVKRKLSSKFDMKDLGATKFILGIEIKRDRAAINLWLNQRLYSGIGFEHRVMKISCDSQSAIFLVKNPTYHLKTKKIDVQYHFVRDMVESNKVLLEKVDTLENIADSLTKSMSVMNFS